ncbi:MAG: glutamine--fructose-6-phosphate transaminase (isomerizing), partial [Granulosicoccaceae bacterium]
MCGIVGAVAQRDISEILIMGLQSLEYRGYDSAGVATVGTDGELRRLRRVGKVKALADAVASEGMPGGTGIAHTRWATHGEPNEQNAHPHVSTDRIAVVHNGIIENHEALREQLIAAGYVFTSDTDTEVIAHLVDLELKTSDSLFAAVQKTVKKLEGAYGTVILDREQPERLIVARSGSPLVIGYGVGEHFIASDQLALLPVTRRFAYLEEGDVAEVMRESVKIVDIDGNPVERAIETSNLTQDAGDKGNYRHYMQKEIYEQPVAIARTVDGRLSDGKVLDEAFGEGATDLLSKVEHVQIIACGTSYHAGMTARYWFEDFG